LRHARQIRGQFLQHEFAPRVELCPSRSELGPWRRTLSPSAEQTIFTPRGPS
jgi:hypothetical protein